MSWCARKSWRSRAFGTIRKTAAISASTSCLKKSGTLPGLVAVRELGVLSPLRHVGLNKAEIRELSRELGLSTWDKQSFACLSSRFVYGETINEERLSMVDRAEQLLLDLGFHQVRVRIHGQLARIETDPAEFEKLLSEREKVTSAFRDYGFAYVTMDLTGYRTGSMNETFRKEDQVC